MIDNDHPFADNGDKAKNVAELPFTDKSYVSRETKPKSKITPKQREQKVYSEISRSLQNIKMSEQLFASGKKQVIFGNVPSKSNCYRIVTKGEYSSLAKTQKLVQFEKDFFIQCNVYRNKMLEGYLQIEVDVFYPNQRSDLDNSLKVILDCLQKVKAFENDNKVVDIRIRKFLDKANPRVEFTLKEAM